MDMLQHVATWTNKTWTCWKKNSIFHHEHVLTRSFHVMFWTCFNVDMFQHPPPPSKKGHAQTWKYSNMDMFQHGNVPTWKCCIICTVTKWTCSNVDVFQHGTALISQHGQCTTWTCFNPLGLLPHTNTGTKKTLWKGLGLGCKTAIKEHPTTCKAFPLQVEIKPKHVHSIGIRLTGYRVPDSSGPWLVILFIKADNGDSLQTKQRQFAEWKTAHEGCTITVINFDGISLSLSLQLLLYWH